MEMADDIGGVMYHQVQTIGGIHQAPNAPEGKQQHRQHLRGEGRITPGQLGKPGQQPAPATRPGAAFQGGHHVEERQQAREKDRKRQEGVRELPALPNAGICKLVVHAHWRGQEQEKDK
jgi:hypothetical protein